MAPEPAEQSWEQHRSIKTTNVCMMRAYKTTEARAKATKEADALRSELHEDWGGAGAIHSNQVQKNLGVLQCSTPHQGRPPQEMEAASSSALCVVPPGV